MMYFESYILSREVLNRETHTPLLNLVKLNNGVNTGYPITGYGYGLVNWKMQFTVKVKKLKTKKIKTFTVIFQPFDFINEVSDYKGWELTSALQYGDISDESKHLLDFCDGDDCIIVHLREQAESTARWVLKDLFSELKA